MTGKPWQWWTLKPHGTSAAFRRHCRNGEKPVRDHCPACADAEMLRVAEWRERTGYYARRQQARKEAAA